MYKSKIFVLILLGILSILPIVVTNANSSNSKSPVNFATESSNWAGYAAGSSNAHTVTDVEGYWYVNTLSCSITPNARVATWVGIDGESLVIDPNSNTVEQTGTESVCNNGVASYRAWFELYPSAPIFIDTIPYIGWSPQAGDQMFADVSVSGNNLYITIYDNTLGQHYSNYFPVQSSWRLSTAEWIEERVNSYDVANFGSQVFFNCYATISGYHRGIWGFDSSQSSFSRIAHFNVYSNGYELIGSSSLTTATSFYVSWHRAS